MRAEICYLENLQMSTIIILRNDYQYSIPTKNNVTVYKDIFHYYISLIFI